MGDSSVYSDIGQCYPSGEGKAQVQKKKSDTKSKILLILVIIIFTLIGIELFLYAVVFPLATAVDVQFKGLQKIDENDLIQKSSLLFSQPWIKIDQGSVAAFFYDHPLVDTVKVEKIFPNQIIVEIEERVPIATAIVLSEGKSIPLVIDKKGFIFQVGGNVPEGLPLISGLNFETVQVGMRLHEKLRPLMEQLAKIIETNPSYLASISELKIISKEYGNYELAAYPVNSKVKVLLDRNFNTEILQYMMVVLDVIASVDTQVYEVDLRYGSISYKTR